MKVLNGMIVIISLAATPLFAKSSPLPLSLQKAAAHFQHAAKSHKTFSPQCTNFTGNWHGTCVDQHGHNEESKLTIKQDDCISMSLDNFDYNLNGSVSIASNPNPEANALTFSGTLAYAWNDSQTKLRRLTTVTLGNGVAAAIANTSLWLSGDQLRVKDELSTPLMDINGVSNLEMVVEDCSYTKE